jgi:hypothetical protein
VVWVVRAARAGVTGTGVGEGRPRGPRRQPGEQARRMRSKTGKIRKYLGKSIGIDKKTI